MSDLTGHSLGRYHILESLGEGGMALVYKAYDTRLENVVAVKVIRSERLSPELLQKALKRFEREAKSLAQLTHPNIVNVLDYGDYKGQPYLVMPYVPGGTLKQLLNGKPMQWQRAARLLIPIARALDYAHKRGIVHRDIKPANIMITESGEPMLADFGIAKIIDEEATLDLTGTSAAVGTPEYMAPEQATSKTTDHRVDIYALGIVLYEMVTGRKPFQADTPLAVLFKHASEPLPRPSQFAAGIPDQVEKILVKALAKKPAERYQSMGEIASELDTLLSGNLPTLRSFSSKGETASTSTIAPFRVTTKKNVRLWASLALVSIAAVGIFMTRLAKGNVMQQTSPTSGTPTATNTLTLTNTPPSTSTPLIVPTTTLGMGSTIIGAEGMTHLYVPAGEFIMGSDTGNTDEQPVHTVFLNAYWIDQTEVTNKLFSSFVSETGYQTDAEKLGYSIIIYGSKGTQTLGVNWRHPTGPDSDISDKADYPAVHMSWNDAVAYCEWAGGRLPTEAEWEKAASWNDIKKEKYIYPWGDEFISSSVNFCDKNCVYDWGEKNSEDGFAGLSPVMSYPEGISPYGAYDMAGNAWEWVSDWYSSTYYQGSPAANPLGPDAGQYRIMKGGSWDSNYVNGRSAFRFKKEPLHSRFYNGFRCAYSTP